MCLCMKHVDAIKVRNRTTCFELAGFGFVRIGRCLERIRSVYVGVALA